ncbi:MAG: UpxY family transcription antiterminator [Saprospiraceae bacterium]|nr:UpxY family transcription antiterminator [Saprospiraceae bacterium]
MRMIHELPIRRKEAEAQQWFAVYTAFRSEKQVAAQLRKKNVEVYLPLISRTKRYMRKLKTYQIPMLGCYLFVRIKQSQSLKVLETERVVKIISDHGHPSPIREEEINMLKRIEGLDIGIDNNMQALCTGDRVIIKKGNLAGLNGRLLKQTGKRTFMVELESLGIALHLSVDVDLLHKINKAEVLTA